MKLNNLRQLIKEELHKVINEGVLIPKKEIIANILAAANIPDEIFAPQSKSMAVNFIENGNPSEIYLEKIIDILNSNGIDVASIYAPEPEKKPYTPSGPKPEINPYDTVAGRPSIGYMGARSTGD
jgi:hypothetical protein